LWKIDYLTDGILKANLFELENDEMENEEGDAMMKSLTFRERC
jgi:hypothetical protein